MMLSRISRLAIAVIGTAALACGQDEVVARRLSILIRGLGTDPITSAEELVRMGAPAVPELLEVARSGRPPVRFRAIEVLGRMGPQASEVLPVLIELAPDLVDSEMLVVIRAIGELLPYREEDFPELEAILTPLVVRAYASTSAESQVSILMAMDRALSRRALGPATPLEELQESLQSENAYHRELAAELLGHRGAEAKSALKALDDMAADFDQPEVMGWDDQSWDYSTEIQRAAVNAILAIATDEELYIGRAHAIRLGAGTRAERIASAQELTKMAPAIAANDLLCPEVVFYLVSRIADEQTSELAKQGIVALGEIGKDIVSWESARYLATTAVPMLQSLSRSRDEEVSQRARAALDKIRREGS